MEFVVLADLLVLVRSDALALDVLQGELSVERVRVQLAKHLLGGVVLELKKS